VVLASLPASVEVDRAWLEFAQLLLEDLRRIDHQRRDIRRRLATMVAGAEDPAERRLRRRADHRRLREVSGAGIASIVGRRDRPRAYGGVDFTVLATPEPTPSSP
jgi:hypothetical protein